MVRYIDGVRRVAVRGPHFAVGRTMAIHTGLSRTICGHVVALDRDAHSMVATVTVTCKPGQNPKLTDTEKSAVSVAADLVAKLARRVLVGWTVVPWSGQQATTGG